MNDESTRGNDDRQGVRAADQRKPRNRLVIAIIVAVVAAIVAGSFWLAKSSVTQQQQQQQRRGFGRRGGDIGQPLPVGIAKAETQDLNVYLTALGAVAPLNTVTVHSRVDGELMRVAYKEGQHVKAGELLAEIDPRPLQTQLDQALGAEQRDAALLAAAKVDLARYQALFAEDSIAKQQLDTQASLVKQYEGAVKTDQAQIENAKLQLVYARITAPLAGRVGLRQIDPGNMVHAGDSNGIVVITQLQPITVVFSLPEDNLPAVLKQQRAGAALAVDAFDRAQQQQLASGQVVSLDNQIDTSTGTVKVKAQFANDDEALFPNQFVNVRLRLDVVHGATVIPTAALERGADGVFIYVVQPDDTVSVRQIKTGASEGEKIAVVDGLKPGETVVTDGADRLRDGAKVQLPGEEKKDGKPEGGAERWRGKRGEAAPGQGAEKAGEKSGEKPAENKDDAGKHRRGDRGASGN